MGYGKARLVGDGVRKAMGIVGPHGAWRTFFLYPELSRKCSEDSMHDVILVIKDT